MVQVRSPAPGEVPEWPKGADCKSVSYAFDGSNPSLPTITDRVIDTIYQLLYRFFYAQKPLF